MTSGIYFIVHKKSLKRYVGKAKDLKRRLSTHWSELKHNKHDNDHLQNAYNLYGKDAFFVVTTPCAVENLLEREQYFIDTMWDMCYNICKIANQPPITYGHTWNKGRTAWNKGRKNTPEEKAAKSARMKGKPSLTKGNRYSSAYQRVDEIRADRAAGMSIPNLRAKYKTGVKTIKDILSTKP